MAGVLVEIALIVVAGLFAMFNGANDGGTLLATSLKLASWRPLAAALVLSVSVAVAPALFGTQVATTLAERLVSFHGPQGRLALLVAVTGTTAVVVGLSRGGMPTSLTLALIGAILGVGLGAGLPVAWSSVALVLVLAAAAPFAGLLGAWAVARVWAILPVRATVGRQVRHLHPLGLVLQAFAYGTNDGQKMLAVFALAAAGGTTGGRVATQAWMLLAACVLFAIGILVGIRRYGARMSSAVLPITPVNAVTAQLSAAAAVMCSAAAGAPVSMTQSVAGGLLGSGLAERTGRVRWHQAGGIAATWLLTLPAAALVTALPAAVLVRS